MSLVAEAAHYIGGIDAATVPPAVLERVKTCLLYTVGMTVAGYEEADATGRATRALSPPADGATLFVTGERRESAAAAFANAALACARGQNDTHPGAVGHAGCIIVPAVLAVAEQRGASGADILSALIAGYELLPKLAGDAAGEVVARGLRATSVFGPLVAAAAVARLLRLDAGRTAHALSIATQFAGGTMQCWQEGTAEWRLQVGHSAQAGVTAAYLAEQGATGATQALEGKAGYYNAFFGRVPKVSFSGWHLGEMVFKPYPGCMINQGAIYLVRGLMRQENISGADVAGATVWMSERDARYPGTATYGPFTQATGAVMSLPFMVAAMLRDQHVSTAQFRDWHAEHPIHAASRDVRLEIDPAMKPWACRVELTLRDGRKLEAAMTDQSKFALGWDDTAQLLNDLVGEWPLPQAAQRYAQLKTLIAGLDRQGQASDILALCVR